MKLTKKKVFALAMVVCLIATLSMGSLAWFTDSDEVTNDFLIAGSDDENPDDVFSVDVWEEGDAEDDGLEYGDILPGDDLYKNANVENTGSYDQYVRVIVTVTDASIWQAIYGEVYVPLNKIATDLNADFLPWSIEFNADKDTLTYVLYYNADDGILEPDEVVNLFTNVHIPEELDRYQAAEMAGGFQINIVAEAVQTENVGANAAEAFATVDMAIEPGNRTIMTTAEGLKNVLTSGVWDTVVLGEEYAGVTTVIDYPVADVVIDANGQDLALEFTSELENVTVTNIQDSADSTYRSVSVSGATGNIAIINSKFIDKNGSPYGAIYISATGADVTVDNCEFVGDAKSYGIYGSGCGNLTVTNSSFEGTGSWAMLINGTIYGNVLVDNCTFTNCTDGILKCSVAGGGHNGLLNGDFSFTNNTLTNCEGHDGVETKMFTAKVTGTITVEGNTRDGAEYIPGSESGITQN